MSNFQKDVQLLADLQGLIEKREKQVNPPEGSTAIMGAISPVLRASKPSISQEMVDNFILETWTQTAGEKTTIVRAMLRNGFELVEASSCVSPENYDEKLGREICMKKIKDRVWHLLGFLLQTAVNGVK